MAVVLLSLAAGLGCSTTRLAAVEIGPPGADPSVSGEEGARQDRLHPEGPGCAWTGAMVTPRGEDLPLCFAVDGACFAQIAAPFVGRAVVTLPEGRPAERGAKLDLVDGGVRLTAWTAGDSLLLFAQHPISFGGAAVVIGGPSLFVERVHNGTVELVYRGDAGVRLRGGALHARAGCAGVGLLPDQWDPAEVLAAAGVPRAAPTDGLLPVDQPIALSPNPGGVPALDVVIPSEELSRVEIVEQRGPWSRVLWWQSDGGVVFGWVDTAALGAAPPRAEPVGSSANSPGAGGVLIPMPGTICPADVALFADVAGTTAEVGAIVATTRFDVTRMARNEYTEIKLRSHHLESMPESAWLVRTADLQACGVR